MFLCGVCHRPPRADDPLEVFQHPAPSGATITIVACSECGDGIAHRQAGVPRTYPHGRDWPFKVCGVCRLALRINDPGEIMRLAAEDVAGEGLCPGCYGSCCSECVEKYRPRIYRRLEAHPEQRAFAPLPEFSRFRGNWLL